MSEPTTPVREIVQPERCRNRTCELFADWPHDGDLAMEIICDECGAANAIHMSSDFSDFQTNLAGKITKPRVAYVLEHRYDIKFELVAEAITQRILYPSTKMPQICRIVIDACFENFLTAEIEWMATCTIADFTNRVNCQHVMKLLLSPEIWPAVGTNFASSREEFETAVLMSIALCESPKYLCAGLDVANPEIALHALYGMFADIFDQPATQADHNQQALLIAYDV